MGFRALAIIEIAFIMSGCGLLGIQMYKAPEPAPAPVYEAYDPIGKEQFVMNAKAFGHSGYSYQKLCAEPSSERCWFLDYREYVGKAGYLKTGEPITDKTGVTFYEAILADGRRLFVNAGVGNVKFDGTELVTAKQWEVLNVYQPKPLTDRSTLRLIAFDPVREEFTLSNGKKLSHSDVDTLRNLFSKYPFTLRAEELLFRFQLTYEPKRDLYLIEPYSLITSAYRPYIGLSGSRKSLRIKLWYAGKKRLLATEYEIVADDYRWASPPQVFGLASLHTAGWWEWTDVAWSETEMATTKAIANAKSAVIHFKGAENPQFGRETLTQDQKDTIKEILELYAEIGSAVASDSIQTAGPRARDENLGL